MKKATEKPLKHAGSEPDLAAGAGSVRTPEVPPAKELWEDGTFAVTKDGLAMKRYVLLIPISALGAVGEAARALSTEHSDSPFMEAVDQAVRHHLPTEFPDGVRLPSKPATPAKKK